MFIRRLCNRPCCLHAVKVMVFVSWNLLLWSKPGWPVSEWNTRLATDNTLVTTSIRHRIDTFVLSRHKIDVNGKGFAAYALSRLWDRCHGIQHTGVPQWPPLTEWSIRIGKNTHVSTSIRHRSDTYVSDRCLIEVDIDAFAARGLSRWHEAAARQWPSIDW